MHVQYACAHIYPVKATLHVRTVTHTLITSYTLYICGYHSLIVCPYTYMYSTVHIHTLCTYTHIMYKMYIYNVQCTYIPRRWTDGSSNISTIVVKMRKMPYFIGNTIKLVVFVSKTAVLGLFFRFFRVFSAFHFRVRFHFLKRIIR